MRPTQIRDNKMKNLLPKSLLFLVLGLITTVFYSCSKDDSGNEYSNAATITATNVINQYSPEEMVPDIVTVIAETTDGDLSYYKFAEAQYKNNGFTMKLPATVPAQYLIPMFDYPEGVTVSDKTAKQTYFGTFSVYDKDNNELGELIYSSGYDNYYDNDSDSYYDSADAVWMYVDKKVTIKGECDYGDGPEIYDLTLVKGWNIIYQIYSSLSKSTYTYKESSQLPSGVTLKWYYY